MTEEALVLVHLERNVRLVLRKRSGKYRFESWQVPAQGGRDLLLRWKLEQNPAEELRRRSFVSIDEAKQVFSSELARLVGSGRVVR
jgi:hypothetical protein